MAQFFVVALFAFVLAIFVLDRIKRKVIKNAKRKSGLEENRGDQQGGGGSKNWFEMIPGPKPFPWHFIGNAFQVQPVKDATRIFFGWCRQFPICFKFIVFNKTFVFLNNPQAVNAMLKSTNLGHLTKSFVYDHMKPYMSTGLIPASGQFWQHHRKILNRSMNCGSLRKYTAMLNRHSQALVSSLEKLFADGQPHQINVQLNCTFLQVVCELLTGPKISVEETDVIEYHHDFQSWKASVVKRLIKPWFLFDFIFKLHPMARQYYKTVDKLHDFAKRVINKHKVYYDENTDENNNFSRDEGQEPFESMLSDLRKAGVDENQIMEEVNSLLLAGHETVASTMHFFCFMMALHPEHQEACRQEINGVFNDPMLCSDGKLSYEGLYELKYLERCIMETLRLFPPVFIYMRQLEAPMPLQIEENTVELPKGTNVIIVPAAIQMNPDYYPDPKKFDPDRFLPEEISKRPAGSFMPFSGGPRGCLGVKFAMLEMKMIAAYLLRRLELGTTNKRNEIPICPFVTLTPKRDYTFTAKFREIC